MRIYTVTISNNGVITDIVNVKADNIKQVPQKVDKYIKTMQYKGCRISKIEEIVNKTI